MVIRETAWHFRFQKFMRGRNEISNSLCGYFWGFVVSVLKLTFVSLSIMFVGACMFAAATRVLGGEEMLAQWFGASGGPLLLFGLILWAGLIISVILFVGYVIWVELIDPALERRKLAQLSAPHASASMLYMIALWISAQYHKVCPLIEFDDGKMLAIVDCVDCDGKGRIEKQTNVGDVMVSSFGCYMCDQTGKIRKRVLRPKGMAYGAEES